MKFFKNPPKKRRKGKGKKRRSAAQVAATRKLVAMNKARKKKGKKRSAVKRKARRTSRKRVNTNTGVRKMAKRRRKSPSRARARKGGARRRSSKRRRSGNITLSRVKGKVYRSNPGGLIKQAMQGAKDAGYVLAGGAATRAVSNIVPLAKTGIMGAAVQLASALAVGMVARRFLGADAARFVVAGGMQVPVKSLVTSLVPAAAPLLGDYDMLLAYPQDVSSYPALAGTDYDMQYSQASDIESYAE